MISSPLRRLGVILIILGALVSAVDLALAQTGHSPHGQATPAASTSAWQVTDLRELEIEGELLALSPDAQWVAGLNPERFFCVWNLESLEATCDASYANVQRESVRWAPDSSAVAFGLDFLVIPNDSDVLVFELAQGAITNLTDDGYEGNRPESPLNPAEPILLDVFPAWRPDSQSLVFARSDVQPRDDALKLMEIDRAGGEPVLLHPVHDDARLSVTSPLFPLDDGSILYSLGFGPDHDSDNGVYLLGTDGVSRHVMPGASDDEFPSPAVVDVAQTEEGVTAFGYARVAIDATMPLGTKLFDLHAGTGEVTPVGLDGPTLGYVTPPSHGPDGASTVGLARLDDTTHVVLTDPHGVQLDLGEYPYASYSFILGIDWVGSDTIFIPFAGSGGVLVTVTAT